MTTWRDIAHQLTPIQIGYLEQLEVDPLPAGLFATAAQHLELARGWALENLEQLFHSDVPPPANVVNLGPWRQAKSGVRARVYCSRSEGVAGLDITIELAGLQYADGRLDGRITIAGPGLAGLDPASAREVAASLEKMADQF